jgi:PadR family transcriptional regulator PadR
MLLLVLTGWFERREREALAYLIEENRLLRNVASSLDSAREFGIRDTQALTEETESSPIGSSVFERHHKVPQEQFEQHMLTGNRDNSRLLLTFDRRSFCMAPFDADIPYGTLDLMVLKTLDAMGSLHGYGIARRIEQVAQGSLALNQGTIYPALLRLEQKGWIASEWGTSDNNRRARFYALTKAGKKQLAAEMESWLRSVAIVNRMIESTS